MGDEPRNAAADFARLMVEVINDREFVMSDGASRFAAPGFTRIDRRALIAQPPTDFDGYRASHLALEELAGSWPVYMLREILAVRGERLVAIRGAISVGDTDELDQILLVQIDDELERAELLILYDPDALETALAELDHLHNEVGEA